MAKRARSDSDAVALTAPLPGQASELSAIVESRSEAHPKFRHVDEEDTHNHPPTLIVCSLSGHREPLHFQSYSEYENHYTSAHVNRCSTCRKNFPTDRFLTIHIEENHDALVAARRERGEKTYSCLVEDCNRKCSTPQTRRLHLIDKHMFPRDYDFRIINDGIDNRSSMLISGRPQKHAIKMQAPVARSSNHVSTSSPSTQPRDVDMDDLSNAMSALKFVPPSVRMRQAKPRDGKSPASTVQNPNDTSALEKDP